MHCDKNNSDKGLDKLNIFQQVKKTHITQEPITAKQRQRGDDREQGHKNKEQFTMMNAIDWKSGLKLENSLTFLINRSSVPYKILIFR